MWIPWIGDRLVWSLGSEDGGGVEDLVAKTWNAAACCGPEMTSTSADMSASERRSARAWTISEGEEGEEHVGFAGVR
jgi:hypothetical protein